MVDPVIRAIAALDDESRRGMYAYIRAAGRPVTRDEAAAAVGISRKLAAFHLDKLVDAGVLRASYRQTAGKVGRAPKAYEPADHDLRVSIPPRQHDVLAEILMDAVLVDAGSARDAALRIARERGRALGAAEREASRPGRLGPERALTLAVAVLGRHGFEPARATPTCVRLSTCPFHPLAARAPHLVCAINHAFLTGVLDGLDATAVHVVRDSDPGGCCVALRPTR